jgi:cytochrome P450
LIGQLEEYFPNAQAYIPERWMRGDPQESNHHPYALLPFGFGTRMCIGRKLAEFEMWQFTIKVSLTL